MALRRPLPCESAGITGRRRTPAVQPRRPPRLPGPQTANCPQMMTTGPTGSTTGTFRAAGCGPLQPRTPGAHGDRIPVPDGVERPCPNKNVPARGDMSPDARSAPAWAPHPRQHEGPVAVGPSTNHNRPRARTLNRPSAAAFRRQNAGMTAPSGQVLLM